MHAETNYDTTVALLGIDGIGDTMTFVIPFPVYLREEDKITFSGNSYANMMTHDIYNRATVSRNGKNLFEIRGSDMKFLTELRKLEGKVAA